MALRISPSITLDDDEITERFVRAQGPGGQNVNKVSTAVELRLDVIGSPNLPERVKRNLARLAGRRLTQDGVLVLFVDQYRTQSRNREAARDRLIDLIREAAAPPPKRRIATKPSRGAKERRLAEKKNRGSIKAGRGRVGRDD
ncbi:MAG: aminoacyl-tRNA hydrolase [Neomegalonema sp.]|nr:aminoacyl-tRNA hydrolase [Neomegalonema sp.]